MFNGLQLTMTWTMSAMARARARERVRWRGRGWWRRGEIQAGRRRKRKGNCFGVELKVFEVEVWRRGEVKPYFSLWKAREGCLLGSVWGRQVLGSFWRGWISALRMGKKMNGRRVGRRRGEVIPWCAKLIRWAQAWSSCLPKAISSSFQLQIVHGLKHWILDFLIFEIVYSMKKIDFGKCSKSVKEDCSCCPLFSSLCLFFLFASLLYLACLNDPKSCQNTKTSHKYD